jgi:hypothetical protein
VERERSLNADPERLLSDGERLSRPRALAFDHDALEDLDTPSLALDHLKVNADGVARLESGAIAAQLPLLEVLDDTMHKNGPRWGRRPMLANDQGRLSRRGNRRRPTSASPSDT